MSAHKLIVLITSQVEEGYRIGDAWRKAGAPGVTFLEGFGLANVQKTVSTAEVLPGMLSALEILRENRETSLMLLSLVHDEKLIPSLFSEAKAVLGDMLSPNAGVMFVIDVEQAMGIRLYSGE
jgi:hypothetical protein